MNLGTVVQAFGTFAVTNVDDLIVLAVFFGQAAEGRGAAVRVFVGQYLGFGAILLVSIVIAVVGSKLLPSAALPYFGLVPILMGLRAALIAWRERRSQIDDFREDNVDRRNGPAAWHVAAVTFGNSADNIGVYVPIFAVSTIAVISVFAVVFLIGVAILCAGGWCLAARPVIAKALTRWDHIVLPVVLIAIGVAILIEGRAFGM